MTTEAASPALFRILVAPDLSARSDRAVERAVIVAKRTRAALTMLHVVDADLPSRIGDRLHDDARSLTGDHLAALPGAERCMRTSRSSSARIATTSRPSPRRRERIDRAGVHRNESRELFRGTTAERVIRTGTHPVLMVKTRPQAFYRRVIIGVDFSDCSRRALEFAAPIIPDGEFHLVHAFDVPFKGFLPGDEIRREVSKRHRDRINQFVGGDFAALQAIREATPARLFQIIRQGSVRQLVEEQVGRLKPDLLVVGTHGRSGIAHAMLGGEAEDFLSNPPGDVLAVRP